MKKKHWHTDYISIQIGWKKTETKPQNMIVRKYSKQTKV
jgi:Uri superfamily endonuclease